VDIFVLRDRLKFVPSFRPEQIISPPVSFKTSTALTWRLMSSGMGRREVWWIVTKISGNLVPSFSTLKMDTADSSESLVIFYKSIRSHTPEDRNLNVHHRANLKSHNINPSCHERILRWSKEPQYPVPSC
jgi:hypothetical protein